MLGWILIHFLMLPDEMWSLHFTFQEGIGPIIIHFHCSGISQSFAGWGAIHSPIDSR
jgi:hypothetical protein